jgi:TnpA family transposase
MMRMASSLKLGIIHASELIRSLLRSSRLSGLAQAIMEVSLVDKTLYFLNYIDDKDYRRRILTQLNRGRGTSCRGSGHLLRTTRHVDLLTNR